jgi:galactose mutarotase-like enzyme
MTLLQRDTPFPHWQFTAANGDQLRLVPERGGLVCGWRCGGQEQLYFDAERFADPAKSVRGGIPVLFPVCGNLPDGQLELPQGRFAMAQHGFARDLPWQLEALADGAGIRLLLRDSAATRTQYPFAFALSLEVRLEPEALALCALVRHEAGAVSSASASEAAAAPLMPFAFGLHPYFAVPDLAAAALDGLPEVCFDHLSGSSTATAAQLQRLEQGVDLRVDAALPTAAGLALAPALITAPGGSRLTLELEQPFDHAVVWTDPPRPMVCLEPWTARRGELGLALAPGEQRVLRCRYRLSGA